MIQQKPDFERLSDGITRAKVYWDHGDFDCARAYLKVIGSIAMSYAEPIDPMAPVPESASLSGAKRFEHAHSHKSQA